MKAANLFMSLVTVFITCPISIYMAWLLYQHVQATSLMWFLFWSYWPLVFLLQIFTTIATKYSDKGK